MEKSFRHVNFITRADSSGDFHRSVKVNEDFGKTHTQRHFCRSAGADSKPNTETSEKFYDRVIIASVVMSASHVNDNEDEISHAPSATADSCKGCENNGLLGPGGKGGQQLAYA